MTTSTDPVEIPKVIHLCWFGGGEYPSKIQRCIDSWHRFLPDYTIKRWDYAMAKAIGVPFIDEALSVRKWAFAADVVRLHALYHDGGLYMDSDILVKRRFDEFLNAGTVLFQEYHARDVRTNPAGLLSPEGINLCPGRPVCGIGIQAAFMASMPGQPVIRHLFDLYTERRFILPDGSFHEQPIAPALYAMALERLGYRYADIEQRVDGAHIYPSRYLAGHRSEDSGDAFAIHLVAHSWRNKSIFQKIFGKRR